MIRVNSLRLGFNKSATKTNENIQYQTAPKVSNNGQLAQDTVTFSGKLPRTRTIRKFMPSENFITKKRLTWHTDKILPDGTQVQATYKRGKKTYELKTFANNSYSSSEYDRSGKLIQTNNEYYDQNNRLIKDELIDPEGNINTREYFTNGRINNECTTFTSGIKSTQYYSDDGTLLKLVQESSDNVSVVRHYDKNRMVREKIVTTESQSMHYKFDNEQKLTSLTGKMTEPDGSVVKTVYDIASNPPIPIRLLNERPNGTFIKIDLKNGKMVDCTETIINDKNEIVTTNILYNENEAMVRYSEKYPDGMEYIDNYSKDGKHIESKIKITLLEDNSELRREIFYNKAGKPEYGMVFDNGVVTMHTKYDENGILCEIRDADGYVLPMDPTNILDLSEDLQRIQKNNDDWTLVNSLNDVIPDLERFNKVHSN